MRSALTFGLIFIKLILTEALNCAQCNSWHGNYPLSDTTMSTCDNRNNQCQTPQFCVKIIDPMAPGKTYVTYKADCYYQTTLQVSPTNLSYIVPKTCYPFQDGSTPVKRWYYCFCNDRDYCNAASTFALIPIMIFSFIVSFW